MSTDDYARFTDGQFEAMAQEASFGSGKGAAGLASVLHGA
jgi:hypothetical protein